MQFAFGSGAFWATPLTDSAGNAIANPTPVRVGVIQDAMVDVSWTTKQLFGTTQFPVAVGRGTAKATGSFKNAQINGRIWNEVVFGQTLTYGTQRAIVRDSTGTAIPTTPYQITPTPPNSGTFAYDLGVTDANGIQFQRVAATPTSYQYTVAAGVYTFAAADTAKVVYIDYEYSYSVATPNQGSLIVMGNPLLGYVPSFQADLWIPYQTKTSKITLYNCVASKLAIATKLEDFIIPDCTFDFFANANGSVFDISFSE